MKSKSLATVIVGLLLLSIISAVIIYRNMKEIKEGFEAVTNLHTKLEQLDIDAVIYINLDTRTDRNEEILSELSQINMDMKKVHRLRAVKRKWGILGCGLSHIGCLQTIIKKGWKRT